MARTPMFIIPKQANGRAVRVVNAFPRSVRTRSSLAAVEWTPHAGAFFSKFDPLSSSEPWT